MSAPGVTIPSDAFTGEVWVFEDQGLYDIEQDGDMVELSHAQLKLLHQAIGELIQHHGSNA